MINYKNGFLFYESNISVSQACFPGRNFLDATYTPHLCVSPPLPSIITPTSTPSTITQIVIIANEEQVYAHNADYRHSQNGEQVRNLKESSFLLCALRHQTFIT